MTAFQAERFSQLAISAGEDLAPTAINAAWTYDDGSDVERHKPAFIVQRFC
jgi:hypothetical protein